MSRILRATLDAVPAASVAESNLVFSPAPSYSPGSNPLERLLTNQILDPGTSLGFPLASPLGFEPATILFSYGSTTTVGDKVTVYNAPFIRYSAGIPLTEQSFVIDVVHPRGADNMGASYMMVYTVVGGVPT